jgi:hypothetical protein
MFGEQDVKISRVFARTVCGCGGTQPLALKNG